MIVIRGIGTLLAALALSGCATAFTGSAHVEGGRQGCEGKCSGQGLECVGMVYMGEYSDACVCAVPGKAAAVSPEQLSQAAAVAGGSAGVIMQQRQQEQQQQQQHAQN